LKNPCRETKGNFQHKLSDILLLVILAVVCGYRHWNEIELFGKAQVEWLKKFGSFKNRIPSHDTINKVISAIEPERFEKCFTTWIQQIATLDKGEVIAIDDKRIRRSYDIVKGCPAIHMVSAFASQNGLCLGQVSTDQKSNEITAIPQLLKTLVIKGYLVTIDAMGCQTAIAKAIIKKKADYILAVKGNQSSLEEGIKDIALFCKPSDTHTDIDFGHGRIDTRTCKLFKVTDLL
jgi:predicted transposase YbfD/YdcC